LFLRRHSSNWVNHVYLCLSCFMCFLCLYFCNIFYVFHCYVIYNFLTEMRFCHLYHPRIAHLCNVKEVSPSKRFISKSLIYIFYLFASWFHNIQLFYCRIRAQIECWGELHQKWPLQERNRMCHISINFTA